MGKYTKNYKSLTITLEEANEVRVYIDKIYNKTLRTIPYKKIAYAKGTTCTYFDVRFKRDIKNNTVQVTIKPYVKIMGKLYGFEVDNPDEVCGTNYLEGRLLLTTGEELGHCLDGNKETNKIEYRYNAEERTERLYSMINSSLFWLEEGAMFESFGKTVGYIVNINTWIDTSNHDYGEYKRNKDLANIQYDLVRISQLQEPERSTILNKLTKLSKHPVHKEWTDLVKEPYTYLYRKNTSFLTMKVFYIIGAIMGVKGVEREQVIAEYARILDSLIHTESKTKMVEQVDKLLAQKKLQHGVADFVEYLMEDMDKFRGIDFNYMDDKLFKDPDILREFTHGIRKSSRIGGNFKAGMDGTDVKLRQQIKINDNDSKELILAKLDLACALDCSKEVKLPVHSDSRGKQIIYDRESSLFVNLYTGVDDRREGVHRIFNYVAVRKVESYSYFIRRAFELLSEEEACDFVKRAYNFEGVNKIGYGLPFEVRFPTAERVISEYHAVKYDDNKLFFNFDRDREERSYESWKFGTLDDYLQTVQMVYDTLYNQGLGEYLGLLTSDKYRESMGHLYEEYHYATHTFLPKLKELIAQEEERIEEGKNPINRIKNFFTRD